MGGQWMFVCVFVFVVVYTATAGYGHGIPIVPYTNLITKLHNEYRRRVQAADMAEMAWDINLSKYARARVRSCSIEPPTDAIPQYGENVYYSEDINSTIGSFVFEALKEWYTQSQYYKDRRPFYSECGSTCQYTQLVWAKSTEVGCGIRKCGSVAVDAASSSDGPALLIACYYNPRGNLPGEYPYRDGAVCSGCLDGEVCNDLNLCSKSKVKPLILGANTLELTSSRETLSLGELRDEDEEDNMVGEKPQADTSRKSSKRHKKAKKTKLPFPEADYDNRRNIYNTLQNEILPVPRVDTESRRADNWDGVWLTDSTRRFLSRDSRVRSSVWYRYMDREGKMCTCMERERPQATQYEALSRPEPGFVEINGSLSSSEKMTLEATHNSLRRRDNLGEVLWSTDLEKWATYVIRCETEYPGPRDCYTNFGKGNVYEPLSAVVYEWGEEGTNTRKRKRGCRAPLDLKQCNRNLNVMEPGITSMACAAMSCGRARQLTCIYK